MTQREEKSMLDPVLEAEVRVANTKVGRLKAVLLNLVDEAERVVLAEADEGHGLIRLLEAINAGRV
jgi:hypothetical protein